MKKIITKFMVAFLFCTCFLCIGTTQKANAYVDNSYDWGFGVYTVCDEHKKVIAHSPSGINEFILSNNIVQVCTKFSTTAYPGYCYVNVDDNYVGRSSDTGLYSGKYIDGNTHYDLIKIKDLTPGKHKIEVKADRPWNLGFNHGPMQKTDCIYVTAPGTINTTTSAAAKFN